MHQWFKIEKCCESGNNYPPVTFSCIEKKKKKNLKNTSYLLTFFLISNRLTTLYHLSIGLGFDVIYWLAVRLRMCKIFPVTVCWKKHVILFIASLEFQMLLVYVKSKCSEIRWVFGSIRPCAIFSMSLWFKIQSCCRIKAIENSLFN